MRIFYTPLFKGLFKTLRNNFNSEHESTYTIEVPEPTQGQRLVENAKCKKYTNKECNKTFEHFKGTGTYTVRPGRLDLHERGTITN